MTIALILLASLVVPGQASFGADGPQRICLSRTEQRDAVADKRAVSLAAAVEALRERGRRADVVRAELCRSDDRLVYELTLLGRNGKVTRAKIDAVSGQPISGL